ncbi:jerky protein homolog-like [Anastrepha obliqua]|uniref:jerky protein homolog-like n=1 Tax=Anastrepha obliqua TaxID=95512 RepID=UPI002409E9A2|nr:jerky protein homolog-like [Anastrepha obliqua]
MGETRAHMRIEGSALQALCCQLCSNEDFTTVSWEAGDIEFRMASMYLAHEEPVPPQLLVDLITDSETSKSRLILGGDVNAHHSVWGSSDINERGKSTETALNSLVTSIESSFEVKDYSLAAFLDIEGAFNNILPKVITNTLSDLRISGTFVNFIEQLLTSRFRAKFDEMGLMESQIYNVDETGLFYRCLPDKTYVSLFEKTAPGYKIQKERISVLLGVNADGSHKLMPLVIGKAKNPRSFQGFNNPLHYNFSKNAWMTSRIFHDWFLKIFIHEVIRFSQANNLPPKAILLIDNCSAHAPIEKLQSDDGNIIAFFFPPNVTATLQPMDQNPIKLTKLNYRSMLLSQLIAEGGDLKVRLKSFSIRNAIMLLKQAWYDVPERVIKKSWSKLNNWDSDQYESDDDDVPLAQLLQKDQDCNGALQAAQALLTEIEPTNNISIPEIEIWNNDVLDDDPAHDLNSDDESSGSSEFDDREVLPVFSTSTAIESVNNLIKWCTYSESFSAKHTSNLLALRNEIVIAETNKRKKQTAITDYMPAN